MKRAVIFGGMDFIGCDITLKFLDEGFLVRIPDDRLSHFSDRLIKTGLSANINLEVLPIDRHNYSAMRRYFQDCQIVVHCGVPVKLDLQDTHKEVYVPVIQHVRLLLRVLCDLKSVEKVIFITAPMAGKSKGLHPGSLSSERGHLPLRPDKTHMVPSIEKAYFHAEKLMVRSLTRLYENRIEVIIISPVEVENNMLGNSKESTVAGLRYLFERKINFDPVFQLLMNRTVVNNMLNAIDLPERVFQASLGF